jgi:hypothetical protein
VVSGCCCLIGMLLRYWDAVAVLGFCCGIGMLLPDIGMILWYRDVVALSGRCCLIGMLLRYWDAVALTECCGGSTTLNYRKQLHNFFFP